MKKLLFILLSFLPLSCWGEKLSKPIQVELSELYMIDFDEPSLSYPQKFSSLNKEIITFDGEVISETGYSGKEGKKIYSYRVGSFEIKSSSDNPDVEYYILHLNPEDSCDIIELIIDTKNKSVINKMFQIDSQTGDIWNGWVGKGKLQP